MGLRIHMRTFGSRMPDRDKTYCNCEAAVSAYHVCVCVVQEVNYVNMDSEMTRSIRRVSSL